MLIKKIGKLAIRSPITVLLAAKLFFSLHKNNINSGQLDKTIRNLFSDLNFGAGMNAFPRVSIIHTNGQLYYLRLYIPSMLLEAARYLWAVKVTPKLNIITPTIEQTCFTIVAGIKCFAILEHRLPGTVMGNNKWNSILARNFATELNKWHQIANAEFKNYRGTFVHCDKKHFEGRMNLKALPNIALNQEQENLINYANTLIQKQELFTQMCITHGDVNPHNLIIFDENKISWIDMDMISMQPLWYDLATVICKIMIESSPSVIDEFEKEYFENQPELHQEWKQLRHHWLVLFNVLEGVKWFATDRTKRIGSQIFAQHDPETTLWGKRFFTQAAAILNNSDPNLSSGELVRKMYLATERAGLSSTQERNEVSYQQKY